VFSAQTGDYLAGYVASNGVAPRGLSISANGRYVAFSNGGGAVNIYVLDTVSNTLRAPPINNGETLSATISADGNWIAYGFTTLYAAQWNPTAMAYQTAWTYVNNNYYLYFTAISSNGGNPLVSGGWINPRATGCEVNMFSLSTGKQLWNYVGPINEQDQNIVSYMSIHMNYVAVATWGSYNEAANPSPQIMLFNSQSNNTVLSYITPGSMFSADVIVDSNTVYVVAAGKHVQANTMGNGGDLFAFSASASLIGGGDEDD